MQPQLSESGSGPAGLAAVLDVVLDRPCFLCSGSPDGMYIPCAEHYRSVKPILVVVRGAAGELAIVPVLWDGVGEVGCPLLDSVGFVRPDALGGDDAVLARPFRAVGGELLATSSYGDPDLKLYETISAAALVVTWDAAQVWPGVDADALGALFAPPRTLVAPGAPRYGRWPAPWAPWVSLGERLPWSDPPFRQCAPNGSVPAPGAALRAVGLPAPAPGAHPLVEALLLAALLRSAPWGRGQRSIGGRLLPPALPAMTVVGLSAGAVYRVGADDKWQRLFPPHPDGPHPLEIERALGHARMAEALAVGEEEPGGDG